MGKRILAWLLCVAMIASFVPVISVAAESEVTQSPKAGGHAEQQHKCEGCEAVDWQPWPADGTRPAEGHYYLTQNVQLAGMVSVKAGKSLHICLNGYVMTATKDRRLLSAGEAGAELVVTDCTAYTDENGVYQAGALTGGNSNLSSGGGAVYVATNAVFKLYNGRITGNVSKHDDAEGGAIVLGSKGSGGVPGGKFFMYGGEISNNTSTNTEENAVRPGGAIYINSGAVAEITGGTISGNQGHSGGAINVQTGGKLVVENTKLTGNTGTNGGAIYGTGTGEITIKNCEITGNTGTSTNAAGRCAAVYTDGSGSKVTLIGKVIIADNTMALEGIPDLVMSATKARTVYIRDMEEGSRVNFRTTGYNPTEAKEVLLVDTQQTAPWKSEWLTYTDKDGLSHIVGMENGEFVFVTAPAVEPHLHDAQEYTILQNAAQLEEGGYYYLAEDLRLDKAAELDKKNITLHLCLNGHALTPAEGQRLMRLVGTRNIQVVIDDCTAHTDENGVYQAGSLTGADADVNGGLLQVGSTDVVTLKNGKITGNKGKSGGAMILDGTFVLEGGEVSNNQSVNNGGAIYVNNGGTFRMTGGILKDNKGANGGAVYGGGAMEITGGTITGNTATGNGGAIGIVGSKALLLQDVTVTGNTGSSGAVYVGTSVSGVTVSGKTVITDNTSGNLELSGEQTVSLNALHADAKIGITGTPLRYISEKCDDYSANILSDNTKYQVVYQDGALYLDASGNHKHCFCANTSSQCDHGVQTYIEWDDPTKLPVSGNYYLTVDVTVDSRAGLYGGTLNLCLNGHTITTTDRRAFYMYEDSVLRISDCSAEPGKITGAAAGAIVADASCENALVELYNGVLTGNENVSLGGAVMIQGKTTFNMYGGTITGNAVHSKLVVDDEGKPVLDENGSQSVTTTRGGGGVGLNGKETVFHMYGGVITGNQTTKAVYLDKNGKQTNGGGLGGGIHCDKGSVYIHGGEVSQNTTDRSAGGIFVQNGGQVHISGGKITGNTSAASGGGLYISTNCIGNISGGEITGNRAKNGGGFHANTGAQITMTGGKVAGNTTTSSGGGISLSGKGVVMNMTGGEVTGNTGSSGGGILAQSGATLNLKGGKVTGNTVRSSGGGIYISGDSFFNMSGGSVTSNKAKSDAGGIMLVRCQANFTGGSVSYNSSDANGGGMKFSGAKVTASGLTMTGNTAKKHAGAIVTGSSSKTVNGVKVTLYLTANLYGCYFSGNTCGSSGGAILIQSKGTQFNMTNCTFTKNEAKSGGGAFYVSYDTTFKMTGGKLTENYAATGGAVRLNRCSAEFTDVVVENNQSKQGGGLYVSAEGCNLKLNNVKILNNICSGTSGGLYINKATVEMTDTVISGNIVQEKSGGGIYMTGTCQVSMQGGEISNNSCATMGGAMYVNRGCTGEFNNVTVKGNSAKGDGGAINSGGSLTFTGCSFTENESAGNGGAICTNMSGNQWTQDRGGVYLTDCQLTDNSAGAQGGGLYVHAGGPAHLTQVSFTGNDSGLEGAAILADGITELTNVTITGNTSRSDKYAVYMTPADFDGHSYYSGMKKLTGDVIIQDNPGGDLYLDQGIVATVIGDTLGSKAEIHVTLSDGVLTQRVIGIYHYEGEGLTYTLTAGDRSITEPMMPENAPQQPQAEDPAMDNILLYAGVGVFALAVIALAAVLLIKKKTKAKQN